LGAALGRLLPFLAVGVFVLTVSTTIGVAGDTLGYDFLAYHAAAGRVLQGLPAYDTSYEAAGGFGLFYYPPTFVPVVLAYGLLPAGAATWAWIATLLAAFLGGVAILPVSTRTKWLVILLAGLSWPFVYAVKLGQVGPLLFLFFAAGWRGIDRQAVVGIAGALGAAIKIQPGLVLAWALLTRRWLSAMVGGAVLIALALVAVPLAGLGAWADFLGLLARVSDPITTAHNFTPGAVLYQLGVPRDVASMMQWASTALALAAFVVAALRLPAVPSYLVAVIASQLVSPILWDHYAMLLLLPVAWMLDRGRWWAVLIALASSIVLIGVIPAWVYPAAFWVCLIAVVAVARRYSAPSDRQGATYASVTASQE
jgi:alpha-1,2-mannosyltransferase